MFDKVIHNIRTRKNGAYSAIHDSVTFIRRIDFPVIPVVHSALYWCFKLLIASWRHLKNTLLSEPLFRSQTERCGKAFRLFDDIPNILGSVRIMIGENVAFEGNMTIAGGKLAHTSILEIDDNTYLGFCTQFFIGPRIRIGSNVLVANRVTFVGYDSHPLDPVKRAAHEPPDESGSGEIVVGDHAWIGSNSIVLKNVSIGYGAVVATGSVVTRDVPPLTVVAGNPAKVVKTLEFTQPDPPQ